MNDASSQGTREIVLVMGMTGWGKSLWSKLYHRKWKRSLVYDPFMSFPHVMWAPMQQHVDELMEDPEHTKTQLFQRGFPDTDDIPQAGAITFVLGDMILFIEECASVFEKGQARMPEWAKRLCFYGRHNSCSLVLIAQRPTYIPIDFRSQANRVVSFCQHEDADMQWLGDFYGKERMDRLLSIPKFTCFDWHNGEVHEYSIVDSVEKTFGIKLDKRGHSSLSLV